MLDTEIVHWLKISLSMVIQIKIFSRVRETYIGHYLNKYYPPVFQAKISIQL